VIHRRCGLCDAWLESATGDVWKLAAKRPNKRSATLQATVQCDHYPLYRKDEKSSAAQKLLEILETLRDV